MKHSATSENRRVIGYRLSRVKRKDSFVKFEIVEHVEVDVVDIFRFFAIGLQKRRKGAITIVKVL